MRHLTSIEICAGAGGQALGLENAGFHHLALIEIDNHACATLRHNRPNWNIHECDVKEFSANEYAGSVDLLAAGVPCPPFSIAGKKLGELDERNLFPEAIRLVRECKPKAVLFENVRGLMERSFDDYRVFIQRAVEELGYIGSWNLLNACDYGVPQLRPRTIFVALKPEYAQYFTWPDPVAGQHLTVGTALYHEMAKSGWRKVDEWCKQANSIAPTLVGGSKKHGGPDLGPTRSKKAWAEMGVNGMGIADSPPLPEFEGMPKLTVKMAALLQGFPDTWHFTGGKTAAYRQVGNAFPPPVAEAVGLSIIQAIRAFESRERVIA